MGARNVLLVRLDNLGDVLLCTPAFHAVRETLPDARLTLLASPIGAQVAELNPDLDGAIVYQAPWMDAWGTLKQDGERELAMVDLLREQRFDAAIIFTSFRQSALPAAYLCYLAGIPLRLAASIDGPGSLLTTRVKQQEDPRRHEVMRALELVGVEGFHTDQTDLVLQAPETERALAAAWLDELGVPSGGPLVVVHPGCSMPARTYPWELFAEVADLLVERLGATVVFTGDASEVELVDKVRGRMKRNAYSAAGESTFRSFAALVSLADLVITNNTGPAHVAAALKTPVVDLFALTNPPEQWRPWNVPHRLLNKQVPCALCYSRVCPYDQECLRGVSPSEVVEAARDLLREIAEGGTDA
ncbi:MAG TPA: glycosyltransferase family 9 protein [Chloroflexota bacterium]|nr:glycosyltransferase family 9 protein [Chloroflexota bacterium]